MSPAEKLYENLLVLAALLILSIFMVTIIGYFDEGHYHIYESMIAYIKARAYPPLADYAMWFVLSGVIGLIVFNVISEMGEKRASLSFRVLTTILTVPALFFVVIFFLSRTIS
jgi:hypothetical protein